MDDEKVASNRARAALDYHLKGRSLPEVAKKYGFRTVQEASFAIQAAAIERQQARDALALQNVVKDVEQQRTFQLEQCEMMIREAWKQYKKKPGVSWLKSILLIMKRMADLGALDLALAREPSRSVNVNIAAELTNEQLLAIAAQAYGGRRGSRALEAASGDPEPDALHDVHQAGLRPGMVSLPDSGQAGSGPGGQDPPAAD